MPETASKNPFLVVLLLVWYVVSSFLQSVYRKLVPFSWLQPKNIDGKTVLITGAGGGIGFVLATKFAEYGCKLILWDVVSEWNEKTAKSCRDLGAEVFTYAIDITDRKKVYEVAAHIESNIGPVNSDANDSGTTKAFVPKMLERNSGHLVTIASVAGLIGASGLVDYTTSKFAVFGFMEALEHEISNLGNTNIRFTTVCPIFVQTQMINSIDTKHFPVLQPDFVAENIIRAIRLEQRVLMLPKRIYGLYALKGILPWNLYQSLLLKKKMRYS